MSSPLLLRQQQMLRLQKKAAASSSPAPLHRHSAPSSARRCGGGGAAAAILLSTCTPKRRPARPTAAAAASSTATPSAPTSSATIDNSSIPAEADVVIVGAGLAGLAAARALLAASAPQLTVLILEASDGVGGRARTDVHPDGFLLDRGFQIFLTGYPEARRVLNYDDLQLQPFYAGALVRFAGAWHRVADPFRHPLDGLLSLLPSNAVGTPLDKVNVGLFRLKCVLGGSLEALLRAEPEATTRERLSREGFSAAIVDRFFRPFLGGIFFDRSLGVSDRLFAFVMRMLATGSNCLPAKGIGAMAEQLAGGLPRGVVRLGARVESIEREGEGGGEGAVARVRVSSSSSSSSVVVTARKAVIVASEGPEARRLVEGALSSGGGGGGQAAAPGPLLPAALQAPKSPAVGTACLYFDAPPDTLPSSEAILYLNGELSGPQDQALVNNCCFPSTVAPSYAPAGRALVSVSTIGTRPELDDAALEAGVRRELSGWFCEAQVGRWRHLRTYRIPYAQPPQAPPTNLRKPVEAAAAAFSAGGGKSEGGGGWPLFVCGDHMDTATFDGALLSGRRAAEAVLAVVARSKVAA